MKKETILSMYLQVCFVTGLALLMFGCSDGGSYDPDTYVTASGTATQGRIESALVCADLNFNGKCDAGEPFTYTSAVAGLAGNYIIRNIPEGKLYQLISEGGVDSLTGLSALSLRAPQGARNMTPLTTLVAQADNSTEMMALLDALSGGQGYDTDISSAAMPPEFLALAKGVEGLLDTLSSYGLSSVTDQALVLKDLAAEITLNPLTIPGNTLSSVFKAAARRLAARTTFADFKVAPIDVDLFANTIEDMADAISRAVVANVVDNVVVENPALQAAIDNEMAAVPVLPVGGITLTAVSIAILDVNGVEKAKTITTKGGTLAANATDFAKAKITVSADNSTTLGKTYSDASFTLTVIDNNSNRSLQVIAAGVNVVVGPTVTGAPTFSGGTGLVLRGVDGDGKGVVEKTLSSLGNLVIFQGNAILLDINLLRQEVEQVAGVVVASGSYTVGATISGAPGAPASIGLTLN